MRQRDVVTSRELSALVISGLALTVGAVWWLKGLAVAALTLGILLLYAAYACARADD